MAMEQHTLVGTVSRVRWAGPRIVRFEGRGLQAIGAGETLHVEVRGTRYIGEPMHVTSDRAILLIDRERPGHGTFRAHGPAR